MFDTIVLESPEIDYKIATKIEQSSIIRLGIDVENNNMMYKFTSNQLKSSYDTSISIRIKYDRWGYCDTDNLTKKFTSLPYLVIECSLHKFYLGHNCFGGSDNLEYQVIGLINFIEEVFGVTLPNPLDFIVKKIDYAKVYKLGLDIENFFRGFQDVYYPRRKSIKYGLESLYFPGQTTTLKIYDKYSEFKVNDKKRFIKLFGESKYLEHLSFINGILRIELSIKSKKLKDIYTDLPTVKSIKIKDLIEQYEIELLRIFKLGEKNMKIVNNANDVQNRLNYVYGNKGNIYLATWFRLTINGYDNVKNTMSKSTFYRHISKLKDANVSWNHSDVKLIDSKVVNFVFNPFDSDLELNFDLIDSISA